MFCITFHCSHLNQARPGPDPKVTFAVRPRPHADPWSSRCSQETEIRLSGTEHRILGLRYALKLISDFFFRRQVGRNICFFNTLHDMHDISGSGLSVLSSDLRFLLGPWKKSALVCFSVSTQMRFSTTPVIRRAGWTFSFFDAVLYIPVNFLKSLTPFFFWALGTEIQRYRSVCCALTD